jgi:hypothetical protein
MLDVDYDELPAALPEEQNKPSEARKSRILAMKGKDGKDVKTEPTSKKPKTVRGVAPETREKLKKSSPRDARAYVKSEESMRPSKKSHQDFPKVCRSPYFR